MGRAGRCLREQQQEREQQREQRPQLYFLEIKLHLELVFNVVLNLLLTGGSRGQSDEAEQDDEFSRHFQID